MKTKDELIEDFSDACEYNWTSKLDLYWKRIEDGNFTNGEKQKMLDKGLVLQLNRLTDSASSGRITQIMKLLERGAKVKKPKDASVQKSQYATIYAIQFVEEYIKNPEVKNVKKIFKDMTRKEVTAIIDGFCEHVKMYFESLKAGDKSNSDDLFKEFPKGKKFDESYVGTYILFGEGYMSMYAIAEERIHMFTYKTEDSLKYFLPTFLEVHMDYLKEKLEELNSQGVFEGMFESGIMQVLVQYSGDNIHLDCGHSKKDNIDEVIEYCETTTNWNKDSDKMIGVAIALIFGGYGFTDVERGLNILIRLIKESGSSDITNKIYRVVNWLTSYHPAFYYILSIIQFERLDYYWAEKYATRSINKGYPDAQKFHDYVVEVTRQYNLVDKVDVDIESGASVTNIDEKESEDSSTEKATFETIFTQEDLSIDTVNITGDASHEGEISIRFKVENEEGYGEALDFINSLLEKNYAKFVGEVQASRGFSLEVGFAEEPIFIEQLEDAMLLEDLEWPQTSNQAFFARAIQYPNLHNKIITYVERAAVRYDWYLDLEGEYNATPGLFAAMALAFSGKEYFPVVQTYIDAVDGDHSYYQHCLPKILFDYYNGDPDLAPLIYDLVFCGAEIGDYSDIPKEYIWNPLFLKKLLEYTGTDTEEDTEEFYMFAAALYGEEDGKKNLKFLRKQIKESPSNKDKQIYIDFYNYYLAALKENDYEDDHENTRFLKDVEIDASDSNSSLKNQEAVISIEEANQRGYNLKIKKKKKKYIGYFFPSCQLSFERFNSTRTAIRSLKTILEKVDDIFYGNFNLNLGDYYIHSEDLKYESGLIVYNGKSKPVIFYGESEYEIANFITELTKKWPKTTEDYSKYADQFTVDDSMLRRTDNEWINANTYLEPYLKEGGVTTENFHTMTKQLLNVPKEEKLAYISSRVMLAYYSEAHNNLDESLTYYEELKAIDPMNASHWQKEIDETKERIERFNIYEGKK